MNFFELRKNLDPMIGAHRGYRAIRPENTLCSFEASLGKCHYIELDVQMSRDSIPVIVHDEILGRTCDIQAIHNKDVQESLRIDSWNLAELRRLDFGSWFQQDDPFSTLKTGKVLLAELEPHLPQKIMTLAEMLTWSKKVGVPLNIEIKDQFKGKHDAVIVDAVLKEIRAAGYKDQVMISSFQHQYLQQVVEKTPGIPIGVLQKEHHPDDLFTYLSKLEANFYHMQFEIVSDELIRELRHKRFGVNIFTVNDVDFQRRLLKAGVTSIMTDYPDLSLVESL